MVDAWNTSNRPEIELEYVPVSECLNGIKLAVSFASGQAPDLFILSPGDFLRYYNGGVLADLTPYLSAEARADFPANVVASRIVDGRLFAVPMEVEPMAIFYSLEAFEQAGLDENDIPTTWDELLEIAGKLTSSKRFGILFETTPGYYQNFTWYPFMWQGGGEVQSPDGRSAFDSDATVQALRFWQDTVSTGVAPRQGLGRGAGDAIANLASGFCAMQNVGVWAVAQLATSAPEFPYGVFRLPVPTGGKYVTVGGGWAFVANARSDKVDDAARFIAWALASMTDDSVGRLADWCTGVKTNMPPRTSVLEAAHAAFDQGKMRAFSRDTYPGTRGEPRLPPTAYKIVSDAIQATQLGGADPGAVAASASRMLDLDGMLTRYPAQLSGGQRQRVAMGRAIVRDPSVLMFDEPLSNLDAKLRAQLRAEIKELHQRLRTTTVYVTHDQIEAMTMADRIVVLRSGNIEQIGSPMDLYDDPHSLFVAGFIGSPTMNMFPARSTAAFSWREEAFRSRSSVRASGSTPSPSCAVCARTRSSSETRARRRASWWWSRPARTRKWSSAWEKRRSAAYSAREPRCDRVIRCTCTSHR